MDDKQSPDDGNQSGMPSPDAAIADPVVSAMSASAPSALAGAPLPLGQPQSTGPTFISTPATLPPFAPSVLPNAHAAQTAPDLAPPPVAEQPRFELTSLIKTLPEPTPRTVVRPQLPPTPPKDTVADTPAPAPSFIPTAPAPVAAQPSPPAPPFKPFVPPSARPAPPPAAPLAIPTATVTPAPVAPSLPRRIAHATARAARFAAIAAVTWFVTVLLLIALFRFVDPPASMLMLTKRLSGETLQHDWVSLSLVSNNLRRAVITAEDGKFCRHWGFDFGEIRAAMNSSEGFGRGASTITQQLAKNLFLWPGKSYVRKALEVPLTLAIEALWSKQRIIEVYLNIAEWGPGVFGAQAASQYYYGKNATQLTEREAALLAVSLPNPIARDASDPNPAIARRASTLQSRMRVQGISYCALTPKP